jgi:hypothetical protein
MPSSHTLNGVKLFRPAVYANIDASSLGGQSPSTGNLCIVGAFPSFKQSEALAFNSARDLVAYDPSDSELALLGSIAFSPSLDERVPAGVASLSILNTQPTTQASVTFDDADGGDALLIKSRVYGVRGNRATVKIENENTDQVKITVERDGISEIFEGLESGDLASVYYSGSLLDSASLSATRSSVVISWTQADAMNAGALSMNVSDLNVSSTLAVSLSTDTHTQAVNVVISGTSSAGASVTETLTFNAGDDTEQTSANTYSAISSISATSDDAVYAGEVSVSGSLSLTPSDYVTLREMILAINALSGFAGSYDAGRDYPASEIDAIADSTIVGEVNKNIFRADLYAIIQGLGSSQLITAERASGATKSVAQSGGSASETLRLSGGAVSSESLSDWTSALQTIESADLQILVAWSTDIDKQLEVKKHIPLASLAGRERNAWLGSASNASLSTLDANTKRLNDRNLALVGQSIDVIKPNGERATLAPLYLALMLGAMQAGTAVGTPLTRKRPNILDASGNWDANRDATTAIRAGVVSLSPSDLGYRVERAVTTYRTDDNPIYSEVSANESANASIRDLRAGLDRFIGEANQSLTANRIKSIATAKLNRQVQDGIIKSFRDIVLSDAGDTLVISYSVAPVEPLNFIRINANIQR